MITIHILFSALLGVLVVALILTKTEAGVSALLVYFLIGVLLGIKYGGDDND